MSAVRVELCPETGICSVVKEDNQKIDLIPQEVAAIRDAGGDADAIKRVFAECDSAFADSLDADAVRDIASSLR
jgi:hypothetical protein